MRALRAYYIYMSIRLLCTTVELIFAVTLLRVADKKLYTCVLEEANGMYFSNISFLTSMRHKITHGLQLLNARLYNQMV